MHQDAVAYFSDNDAFGKLLGIQITDAGPGYATAEFELEKKHCNCFGTAHAGVLFTLAECAFGAAANAHGKLSVAVSCSISFTKPGLLGRLTAICRETSKGPRISSYVVEISNADNEVIATYQGLAYHRRQPFPPESV